MDNWNGIISLFLFCIELILLINILVFAEKKLSNSLAAALVLLLSLYQLLEYLICGLDLKSSALPYLAFSLIAYLPPLLLNFHLVIFNKWKSAYGTVYLPAVFFTVYYFFQQPAFQVNKCTPFYAVYNYPLGDLYGLFYYTPVVLSLIILYIYRNNPAERRVRAAVRILFTALLFTAVPTVLAFVLTIFNQTMLLNAVESIMCKAAFIYALAAAVFALLNSKDNNAGNNT